MKIEYPHTIENGHGEKIIFHSESMEDGEIKLLVESFVLPGAGPIMHTHFMQDESLTVVSGEMTYRVLGEEPVKALPGQTALFKRGVAHNFVNSGKELLVCKGWIKPANTIVFFLGGIFKAQKKSRTPRPELFDAAYLMTRYRHEYDMPELPFVVKKIINPLVCFTGKLLGKYGHFKDAPEPVKK